MRCRNNHAKAKIKITEKTTLQVTQEETLEISDGVSNQLPPAPQRGPENSENPKRHSPPQQHTQRPQPKRKKPLPPPKPKPAKLVGSISGETLKALTAQQAKPKARIIPDLYFSLLYKKQQQQNTSRKALTGSKTVKALPAPARKRSK